MQRRNGLILFYLFYSLISVFLFLVILDEPEESVILFVSDDSIGYVHEIEIK